MRKGGLPDAALSKWIFKVRSLLACAIVTHMSENAELSHNATTVLSVRLSKQERALLEAASEQARTNLSDFVRRKALDAAELDMMERRIITIPAADWEAFESWTQAPAQDIPGLRDLAARPPASQK